jgi:Fic family protein
MNPPFQITGHILEEISKIERLLGRLESLEHPRPQPQLRKSNRVRTVQGSLSIEGNTLSEEKVTALIEGKTIIGKPSEIQEVLNAIEVYEKIGEFNPLSSRSILKAHRMMMGTLLDSAGKWRSGNVGIFKGSGVSHMAPPASNVPELMKSLFEFLRKDKNHELIKSSVFHYELEFIHPFEDGNGRIGRFWHSLLLTRYHPVFEFTPVESLIKANQQQYYEILGNSDKTGDSTSFVEFSLEMVSQALAGFVDAIRPQPSSAGTRLQSAREHFETRQFTRKDYLKLFKTISTATASRDLIAGVEAGELSREGERALTVYRFNHGH